MSSYRIRVQDRLYAELLTVGSSLGQTFPAMGAKIGESDHAGFSPVRWHFSRYASATDPIYGDWITFAGNATAGRTPAHYPEAAVLRFDRAATDVYMHAYDGRQAIAYVLGTSAVMAGTSESALFGIDPDNEDKYAVAMRIGKGTFKGLPGIVLPQHDTLGGMFRRVPALWMPNGVGIEAERMPLAAVPSSVPIH
jgi:hypothetical protein